MRFIGIGMLLFLALLAGASVGALAKFGFGYELEINGRQAPPHDEPRMMQ
jgi:hypothetical protein